jgi:hypothetical protein
MFATVMKRVLISFSLLVLAACTAHAQKIGLSTTAANLGPLPLPKMTEQLNWLGGGGLWYGEPTSGTLQLTNLGVGWTRSTFGYDSTNTDTFAWRAVQYGGPSSWDWTGADKEINFLQSFPLKVVVQLEQSQDPPWATSLSTSNYVAAKAAFINALAVRYGGKIWGIEVENEPQPFQSGSWTPGGYVAYDRHLAILTASQPARSYTKLVGWACQGSFAVWLQYLLDRGLTNLCDAISWHCYAQGGVGPGEPIDGPLRTIPSQTSVYAGTLYQFMQWIVSQVGNMPVLVDEVGLEHEVPMRMAKVLVILRASGASMCQLQVWDGGAPPGELAAFDNTTGYPFRHAVIAAWTANWLGNDTFVSQTVDSNVFMYAFGTRTYAWCLEGTVRACQPTGWDSITDIYGNNISPALLTDAVMVFNGHGSLTMTNSTPWAVLRLH